MTLEEAQSQYLLGYKDAVNEVARVIKFHTLEGLTHDTVTAMINDVLSIVQEGHVMYINNKEGIEVE